jgi:hypothetical protein
MSVKTSLDWSAVSLEMRNQMHSAPQKCRKDLAKMIGQIEDLVRQLGNEEVELRRNKKLTSPRRDGLLQRINESITEYEKWMVLAYLQHG